MTEPSATPSTEQIEQWRAGLHDASPYNCLDAIESIIEAALEGNADTRLALAPLAPDLAGLLTSEAHVPCTSREHEFSGHALIARSATSAIECVGVPPNLDILRRLLADGRTFLMPEASYDQGAYIGDYSSETIAPAGFAGQLVEMMGIGGLDLLDDLFSAALHEDKLIAWPSQRAIMRIADRAGEATEAQRARLTGLAAMIESMPDAAQPATWRGFALRDLARHLRKRLTV